MPFKIVRNDITRVKADVIVNTANPNPICASGTDLAIYEAAGKEKLLAERANIGKIARGDIAVTGAYNLHSPYLPGLLIQLWQLLFSYSDIAKSLQGFSSFLKYNLLFFY